MTDSNRCNRNAEAPALCTRSQNVETNALLLQPIPFVHMARDAGVLAAESADAAPPNARQLTVSAHVPAQQALQQPVLAHEFSAKQGAAEQQFSGALRPQHTVPVESVSLVSEADGSSPTAVQPEPPPRRPRLPCRSA